MTRPVLTLLALLAVLLAACQQVGRLLDPDVAQLERFQQARARGDLRAIADEEVVETCQHAGTEACARLMAIRAESCLALAMARRAPGAACPAATAEARAELACAHAAFAAAMGSPAGRFTEAQVLALRQGRAQAAYCRAELETVMAGVPLARESLSLSAGLPPARRAAIGGSAALYLARPGAGADSVRCERAREAARLAAAGLAANPEVEERALLLRLAADAAARRATIPGCTP
ncbi:hypothetical protein KO353_05960 [Elioraea tepida]|uniref:Uncharacterized protein n=1 Tax=Elioraea tepida TaxID=2843330 RepID=A0A975YKQ7_9PROT|nr:hypothetical protein [Elioraea tepida]QXM25748.1 hypothetical protein KO353_05960 [Elioraea tepida]